MIQKEIEQLINEDFSNSIKHKICGDIFLATTTYGKFIQENFRFFSYPNYGSLKGELLSYAITRQLYDSAFTPKATYRAESKKVNNYNRSILHLTTEHFVTTIAKTASSKKMPSKSKYKQKYAIANTHCDGQMYFDVINNSPSPISPKYYSIITYGYNTVINECTHINIIIPDSSFKQALVIQDLRKDYVDVKIVAPTSNQEEQIANLHKELENIVRLKTDIIN